MVNDLAPTKPSGFTKNDHKLTMKPIKINHENIPYLPRERTIGQEKAYWIRVNKFNKLRLDMIGAIAEFDSKQYKELRSKRLKIQQSLYELVLKINRKNLGGK